MKHEVVMFVDSNDLNESKFSYSQRFVSIGSRVSWKIPEVPCSKS